jgi:hypothetical protein
VSKSRYASGSVRAADRSKTGAKGEARKRKCRLQMTGVSRFDWTDLQTLCGQVIAKFALKRVIVVESDIRQDLFEGIPIQTAAGGTHYFFISAV